MDPSIQTNVSSNELFLIDRITKYSWNDLFIGDFSQSGTIKPADEKTNTLINPTIIGGDSEGLSTTKVTYTFYEHTVASGTGKGIPVTIMVDRNCTIDKVYAHVETAPGSGKTITVDINKNGTTIFTTQANRPSIIGTNTEAESGNPSIINISKNDKLTMDIDTHDGSAAYLSVYIRCK